MTPDAEKLAAASWADAELRTLRAGAALTFREKPQWLEEAEKLANRLRTCRVRHPDPNNPGAWIVVERAGLHGQSTKRRSTGAATQALRGVS